MAGRRPTMSDRTMSSPITSRASPLHVPTTPMQQRLPLTPPVTPRQGRKSIDSLNDFEPLHERKTSLDYQRSAPRSFNDNGILICPYQVDKLKDTNGRNQTFGYGAWSIVLKATCRPRASESHGLMTPPPSAIVSPPVFVAIKTPARKDAHPILESEGKVLTHLREQDEDELHVVEFLGMLVPEPCLVLAAHPLSLEDHIRTCARQAQLNFTTENMAVPVVGSDSVWLDLAESLISTLDWLHNNACVVHGDLKPGNVLLKPDSTRPFGYRPVLIDFSSSQRLDTDEITLNTLSAITREYTAPELLSSKVLRDPESTATTASDVFSLAVTLLVAATGDLLVYPGCSNMYQRQMLATSGWYVLDSVRGMGSTRLPKKGIVSKVLEKAVLKYDQGRISAQQWLDLARSMQAANPNKL